LELVLIVLGIEVKLDELTFLRDGFHLQGRDPLQIHLGQSNHQSTFTPQPFLQSKSIKSSISDLWHCKSDLSQTFSINLLLVTICRDFSIYNTLRYINLHVLV